MEMNETLHTSCKKSKGVNNLPAADTVPFPTEIHLTPDKKE